MKLSIITPVRNGEAWVLKSLESVPDRPDIEHIVIDDNSTDGTYSMIKLYKHYSEKNILILKNDEQRYPGGTINRGLDIAQGEYILQLDSDDTLETENFIRLLDENHTEDLIFFLNRSNNGDIWNPEVNKGLCDHMCLYKRSLIGSTRHKAGKWGTGWEFHIEILAKPHTEYYSNLVVYNYNFPREGSNWDLGHRGLL